MCVTSRARSVGFDLWRVNCRMTFIFQKIIREHTIIYLPPFVYKMRKNPPQSAIHVPTSARARTRMCMYICMCVFSLIVTAIPFGV